MRFSMISLGALMLATATPALAQEETEPAPAVTVNGSAAVVSDYRFRGISQTDGNFAVQGGITVSHESGFYVSVWGSSIDDYVTMHGTANQEIDLIAGFKKSFGGATVDVGALYYVYPGTRLAGDDSASDFIEPYLAVSYALGPVTAKATAAYAPKQKALAIDQGATGTLPKEDNLYLAGDLSATIPNTPIGVTAHLGHTFGPSWLSGPTDEYTDWALGATYTWKALTLGIQYVDTDTFFITPSGKDAAEGGIVGSLSVSF
ncbi:MAG TPA: TorF family putative porin [Sphingomonas sp.]|nr:TorF family putative porin [Sphingomonas sp.]